MGLEFRSRHQVFGLPLVHVTWGVDPFTGRPRVARGVIAVGQVALGVVAIGPVAVGLAAVGLVAAGLAAAAGQIAAGLWAVGQAAFGGVAALGELATAPVAGGGVTFTTIWPLGAAWLVAALAVGWTWWRGRRVLRLAGRSTRIALAEAGAAVVRGRIVPLKVVEAPVSHRPCVAYDVRRIRVDRPTKVERVCEDFFIDDGSGRARVPAADAQLVLEPVRRVSSAVESHIVAHEVAGAGSGGGVVRAVGTAVERVLLPGDEVIVSGHALCPVGSATQLVHIAFHGGAGGPILVTNRDVRELRAEAQLGLWLAIPLAVAALILLAV